MRAQSLVTVGVVCAIGAGSAPADATPPIPRVRIVVPHIDVPVPRVDRPLAETDWSSSSRLFEERLETAGSPETLAVEDTILAVGRRRLREDAKTCVDQAADNALEAEVGALASGQALPDRQQTHAALEGGIDDCLATAVPAAATPARQKLSGWLADQVVPTVDEAVQTSATVDASIVWPSARTGVPTRPAATTGDSGPDDDDSASPWPVVLVAAALGGGALLLRVRRRS
jgi:MYXO-CTERM domain-containing protein